MTTHTGEQLHAELSGVHDSNVNVGVNNRILEIRNSVVHGDIIQEAQPINLTPRARPLDLPRPVSQVLLDRTADMALALATLSGGGRHVEVSGADGIGKTSLLGHLARRVEPGTFADGAVWLDGAGQTPREDLLNDLFVNFYEADRPYTPTPAQARSHLGSKRALVILDDLGLAREDFQWLSTKAPNATFVVGAESPTLGGEAESIYLGGLPTDDALSLVELVLGRALEADERPLVTTIDSALQNRPLAIVRAMRRVTAGQVTIASLASELKAADARPDARAAAVALAGMRLSLPEERALAALAAPTAAGLAPDTVAAVAGLDDAAAPLAALAERGLARANRLGQYSATPEARAALIGATDLTPIAERTLSYLTEWAERTPHTAGAVQLLAEHSPTVRATLEWATQAGRWSDVQRLGRGVDRALTLSGRSGSRGQTLRMLLAAALALADRPTEAWAFNQLGSQALTRGELLEADANFSRALEQWSAIGDAEGADVARNNLELVRRLRLPPPPPAGSEPRRVPPPVIGLGVLALLVVSATGGAIANGWLGPSTPPLAPPTAVPRPTSMPVRGLEPTATTVTVAGVVTSVAPPPTPGQQLVERAAVAPERLAFGNQRVGTASESRTATITNTGTAPLAIGDISLTTGDFAVSQSCAPELPPGATCTLAVSFKPSAAGTRADTLTVKLGNLAAFTTQLAGTGLVPRLSVVPADGLNFGQIDVGASSDPQGVTVQNTGPLDVSVQQVDTSGEFHRTSDCARLLAPGATCQIVVTFSPAAVGARTGRLVITSDAIGSPQQVALSGNGVQAVPQTPSAVARPDRLVFDPLRIGTTSGGQRVTVVNTGRVSIGGTIGLSGSNTADFVRSADSCTGRELAPQGTCTLDIAFKPGAAGTRSAQLDIGDTRSQMTLAHVALVGSGIAPPALRVAPASLDMGTVLLGAGGSKPVTLTNAGPGEVTLTDLSVTGSSAFSRASTTCGARLAQGSACTVTIAFKPSAVGAQEAQLRVTSDAASPSTTIRLSSSATDPLLRASATSLNFRDVALNGSVAQRVVFTSSGTTPVAIQSPSLGGAHPGDFKFDAGCSGISLSPSKTCIITVTFSPTVAAARTATLTVPNDGRGGALVITLSGTGVTPIP